MTWPDLKDVFADFSPEYTYVKPGRDWGTVRCSDSNNAAAAIEHFNGTLIDGSSQPLEVRLDDKA